MLTIALSSLIFVRILLAIVLLLLTTDISHAIGPNIPGDFDTWENGTYFILGTCLPLIILGFPVFFLTNLIIKRRFVKSVKDSFRYLGYFIGATYLTGIFITIFFMIILNIIDNIWPSEAIKSNYFLYSTIAFYFWSIIILLVVISWIYKDEKETKQQVTEKSGSD